MKLSNRTRYGMRAMLELAARYADGQPLPAHEIAKHNKIPQTFLEQLLRALRKNGLVKSIRGSQGGYVLGKHPASLNVSEVINVLEGPISLAECLDTPTCDESLKCPSRLLWSRIRYSIEEVTKSTTLQDLITGDLEDKERKSDPDE